MIHKPDGDGLSLDVLVKAVSGIMSDVEIVEVSKTDMDDAVVITMAKYNCDEATARFVIANNSGLLDDKE